MPAALSQLLVPENKTNLAAFTPTILNSARAEWLLELQTRMNLLDKARTCVADEFSYGGSAGAVGLFTPLEQAVDEARRMVYALGHEMRRRSEGILPVWEKDSAGPAAGTLLRGTSG